MHITQAFHPSAVRWFSIGFWGTMTIQTYAIWGRFKEAMRNT
jgi:hypothetical protein